MKLYKVDISVNYAISKLILDIIFQIIKELIEIKKLATRPYKVFIKFWAYRNICILIRSKVSAGRWIKCAIGVTVEKHLKNIHSFLDI